MIRELVRGSSYGYGLPEQAYIGRKMAVIVLTAELALENINSRDFSADSLWASWIFRSSCAETPPGIIYKVGEDAGVASTNSSLDQRTLSPILLLSIAGFFAIALVCAFDPLVPSIAKSFEISIAEASAPVTAFLVAYGLVQLAYGPIGKRFGSFRVAQLADSKLILTQDKVLSLVRVSIFYREKNGRIRPTTEVYR